jgi:lipoprotein-releasing system permease protein
MKPDYMKQGTFDLEGDSAVIGIGLAAQLRLGLGDDILVYSPKNLVSKDELYFPERLTITGIYESGQRDYDSQFVIISIDVARDLMGMRKGVRSVHLKVEDPQNTAKFIAITKDVQKLAPDCRVQTWMDIDRVLFDAIAVEKNMMTILLMLINIVGVFCVMNTIIVLTVQKTSEIGLLKAVGFSSWQVMAAFIVHGWIQCFVGTLLGIGAAFAVLNNLQNLVEYLAKIGIAVFPSSVYGLSEIPWKVMPSEIAAVAAVVIVFCTIASFIPALRAVWMDPVAALRKE